jgi:hypothetical protein
MWHHRLCVCVSRLTTRNNNICATSLVKRFVQLKKPHVTGRHTSWMTHPLCVSNYQQLACWFTQHYKEKPATLTNTWYILNTFKQKATLHLNVQNGTYVLIYVLGCSKVIPMRLSQGPTFSAIALRKPRHSLVREMGAVYSSQTLQSTWTTRWCQSPQIYRLHCTLQSTVYHFLRRMPRISSSVLYPRTLSACVLLLAF